MSAKYARAMGLDVAARMKEMYAQTHALSGGRVWTITQIAERFGVSESSARRAIRGMGAYRGVPDAVTDAMLNEDAEKLMLLQRLHDEGRALKENQPDRLLERMDEGGKGADALLEKWQAEPIDFQALKIKTAEIEAEKARKAAESKDAETGEAP